MKLVQRLEEDELDYQTFIDTLNNAKKYKGSIEKVQVVFNFSKNSPYGESWWVLTRIASNKYGFVRVNNSDNPPIFVFPTKQLCIDAAIKAKREVNVFKNAYLLFEFLYQKILF